MDMGGGKGGRDLWCVTLRKMSPPDMSTYQDYLRLFQFGIKSESCAKYEHAELILRITA